LAAPFRKLPARIRHRPENAVSHILLLACLLHHHGSAVVMRLSGHEMEKMTAGRPIPPPDLANGRRITRKHDYRQRSCYVNRQSGRYREWHFGKSKVQTSQPANQRTQTKCGEDMPRLD
jgi:hypothetical protein